MTSYVRRMTIASLACFALLAPGVAQASAGALTAADVPLSTDSSLRCYSQYSNFGVVSFNRAVSILGPYVHYGGNSIVLNAPESVRKQINAELLADLEAGLDGINRHIKEGILTVDFVRESRYAVRDAGVNSVTPYWWGYNIKLSNDTFNRLSAIGFASAGAAGIIATIPGAAPIAGTIAGILGGLTGLLQPCNWNNRGVQIRFMFVGVNHCWPQ